MSDKETEPNPAPATDHGGYPPGGTTFPSIPAGGRVTSVGVDIADVDRIRLMYKRFGKRFPNRVLSESESAYCLSRPDPAPHIAARFAAKEAVVKCLGRRCPLNEIEVSRALTGKPSVILHGRAAELAAGRRVLISLSHLDNVAVAFAVLLEADTEE